jgi:hypothetical protein
MNVQSITKKHLVAANSLYSENPKGSDAASEPGIRTPFDRSSALRSTRPAIPPFRCSSSSPGDGERAVVAVVTEYYCRRRQAHRFMRSDDARGLSDLQVSPTPSDLRAHHERRRQDSAPIRTGVNACRSPSHYVRGRGGQQFFCFPVRLWIAKT